ncbi:RecQ family ATP-dependent DNA helicase [Lentilactobacillus buchneri]|uniref:RecQ family ATP-dependent DNA helicase n=2 Tax=Lentilactobacillus buchneri TaxID=1581 RepID=UPI0002076260|nr:RecQ family ATP-dependent DNA helicase [Lentilactobacillus buchneri]WCJ51726.1 RecQ family ATP-dependent DNA helicase [Lentilactobacillus sp. Egmn17]AEB73298.1 ATP-dependent DNA helicase, RecQ family [Lentilactobacillus buchneri NRRL B-30929]MCT2881854.1 ATP-dependent DNA helicase RecQ [Lentilactobacillus buchneri]MCT2899557.1 ATP-dependent DNA helicase RecQ [Lentilactobacillus buchneri]MCT3555913.1 ATP-dependent DNA helicase RecQ [Lentilactobacillus buchneri]
MVIDLKRELKKYFGFDTFRPGQEKILQNLLAHQDTLAILPTGGGKTLLYQMYGAITHQRVMIVSPLISLMQDQVSRLQFLGSKRVVALTSALDFQEKMAILNHLNRYQFIYVSPEMLANDQVQQRLRRLSIGLFVVDEAHCISEWGPDFRPDYLKLGTVREMLGRPLTLMMTATATQPVRRDIIRHMNFRFEDVHQIVLPVNRANIFLSAKIFANQHDKDAALIELVKQLNGPGIIYFSSKSKAEQAANTLTNETNRRVMAYHGGMDSQPRFHIQQQFLAGNLDIVCATSAFGMGIDKDNIRFVIHYHLPANIQSYVQEIGRCGRDQQPGLAILMYEPNDRGLQMGLIDHTIPDESLLRYLYQHPKALATDDQFRVVKYYHDSGDSFEQAKSIFDHARTRRVKELGAMVQYVYTEKCRRDELLKYFDETVPDGERNPAFCCDHDVDFWNRWQDFNRQYLIQPEKSGQNETKGWQQVIDQLFLSKN